MRGMLVLRVQINPGSNEYIDVEKQFRATGLTCNIISVSLHSYTYMHQNHVYTMFILRNKLLYDNDKQVVQIQ